MAEIHPTAIVYPGTVLGEGVKVLEKPYRIGDARAFMIEGPSRERIELEPQVFDVIPGDATVWEREPLEALSRSGQLSAFKHNGFWQAMDTLRDKNHLEALWASGRAPWKVWR